MYYFVFGILYVISLLPFPVLYLFSDFAYLILYYMIGYRKKIVMDNLANAFPEKTETERKQIAKKFYKNFVDNWIESIKLLSISKRALNKRITGNFDAFYKLHSSGVSVQVNLGHFFNWEMMAVHAGINQPYPFLSVYLPLSSRLLNRLMVHIRGRWGNPLISVSEMVRALIPWRKKQFLLGLGADQSPPVSENAYWLYFLNQPTGFAKGPEKFARVQNLPVLMMTSTRLKRGHYHFDYFLLSQDPGSLPEGELIRRYARHLENNIRKQPELWLWSHRRWKRQWNAAYEQLWVDEAPFPQPKDQKV